MQYIHVQQTLSSSLGKIYRLDRNEDFPPMVSNSHTSCSWQQYCSRVVLLCIVHCAVRTPVCVYWQGRGWWMFSQCPAKVPPDTDGQTDQSSYDATLRKGNGFFYIVFKIEHQLGLVLLHSITKYYRKKYYNTSPNERN